ncbi:IclR family transcriptional regulator [Roseicyclus sp. F158]|uniref:IclR family transcriptional regulator n=1 Tax=Tropicimonas omnivorans TaxID=3075590 RepID=A0ABU3DJD9_9RHOB|nr:IclR family transcriptional regulator [Roseicyclus sp. F158]MDT0683829.1 IclR family transcriptional regulator [Roseicyclus sp. F158]
MDAQEQKQGRSGIQVIHRAARILRVLRGAPEGLSLAGISEEADLPRSTVQRIVGALQTERLVATGENGRLVRLGPGVSELAPRPDRSVIDLCRPLLATLARETGETADLSALRGGEMVFLDQVAGSHRLRTVSFVGEAFPLTATANGRAALAELPPDRAAALAEAEWRKIGRTAQPERLPDLLERIRAGGLAADLDEHTSGISALGFAFTDPAGDIYAISVPVPTSRFKGVKDRVETALRRTKEALTRKEEEAPQ